MMVLMQADATKEQVSEVMETIERHKLRPLNLPGDEHIAVGVASAIPPEVRDPLTACLSALPGVDHVVQISRPYKLASREFWQHDTIVNVKGIEIGGTKCVVMGGPCSVESRDQIFASAQAVKDSGVRILRGGAYKPRTSPYAFQGLGLEGLKLLKEVGDALEMVTISEVMSPEDVNLVASHVDILQIGARNMQNYSLLVAVGKAGRPTLLKRGPAASIDEFLLAAEYLLHHGTPDVILCERGVHPLDRTYTRNTMDINAVPVLKHLTHLPVIVDPSHGTGVARYVTPLAKAAIAAGADGLIVEVHPDPKRALSDGAQSLTPAQFQCLVNEVGRVAQAVGRSI